MENNTKRKLGSKELDRSGYEKKSVICEECGKEEERGKHIGTFTEIWQVGGDKSSRKFLCDDCVQNPVLNPRRETL
jgi:hypothetical protein